MNGQLAIVTGSASGIGKATARLLVERGATVIIADIDVEQGEATAHELGESSQFKRLDVSDERGWVDIVDFAESQFGRFDILVNNAAFLPSNAFVEELTTEEWEKAFRINAMGPFLGCKHAVRSMKARGGAIVNISSNSSMIGMGTTTIYASSKGAVNTLSMTVAAQCRSRKLPIRCNTVIPGATRSRMQRQAFLRSTGVDTEDDSAEAAAFRTGLAEPELVANAIVFLASDEAALINGAELVVDGMFSRSITG
jgi:3(or 17)beta-hydroxysteroid dehydrogenase